jgi:prevent-host-death family protein
MTVRVNIDEAATRLSQLVDQAADGEEVLITRDGRPVARLTALRSAPAVRKSGSLRGKIWIAPDFDQTPDTVCQL